MGQEESANYEGFSTTKEVLGDWVVFTTKDASGETIKRVGFPKVPLVEEDDLRASLEDDELYHSAR